MRLLFFLVFLSCFLFVSCAQPTDSTDDGTVERERIEVLGLITEDTVWERGKEYYLTGDVVVESGVMLTIQPDVWVLFKKERRSDYYGITVEGTLIADGGDSVTAIVFTSGAPVWARKPGDWRGIEVEASSDSSLVIRYCRIEYANVGIKADGSSPRVRYCVVERCADTGILFYGSDRGEVVWCTVRKNKNGIRFELVRNGRIERCIVNENSERGIDCKTSSPDVRNNLVMHNESGIYCWYGSSPAIVHNEIEGCVKGVVQSGDCFSLIYLNEFLDNTRCAISVEYPGYSVVSEPLIEYNNFDGEGFFVRLYDGRINSRDISAYHNWWGTVEEHRISSKIYDREDQINPQYPLGRVLFVPYEMASIDSAGLSLSLVQR